MFETIVRDWCVLVLVPTENGKTNISVFGPYTYLEATNLIVPLVKAGADSDVQVIGTPLKIYEFIGAVV